MKQEDPEVLGVWHPLRVWDEGGNGWFFGQYFAHFILLSFLDFRN